jgi:cell division protein FtsZ
MGGPDMRLSEVNEAATMIMDTANEDANIIFGSVINPDMRDMIKVTVIATGFGRAEAAPVERPAAVQKHILTPNVMMQPRAQYAPPIQAQQPVQRQAAAAVGHDARHDPRVDARHEVRHEPRRASQPAPAPVAAAPARRQAPVASLREDEWDIPTFLRNSGRDE